MVNRLSDSLLCQFNEFVAAQIGLYYPKERHHEFESRIFSIAKQFGYAEIGTFIQWLMSAPLTQEQIETLASHLTVGETYFFREKRTFDVLEKHIFPELIHTRSRNDRRVRIWSAGCCTGEEPYSIAILLNQFIPNWRDWNITILATDINPHFLKKAEQGCYRNWSFRNTQEGIQERYFEKIDDTHFNILPFLKKWVTFSYLNLAKDPFPSLSNNTNAMDIIFCRNVLMYFSPKIVKQVIRNLYLSLIEGGWLIVSPCELSMDLFSQFQSVRFTDTTLYRKDNQPARTIEYIPDKIVEETKAVDFLSLDQPIESLPELDFPLETIEDPPQKIEEPVVPAPPPPSFDEILRLYKLGRYKDVETALLDRLSLHQGKVEELVLFARICANQGKFQEALGWCEKALSAGRLNAGLHYLQAIIFQELGNLEETVASLQRALYLDSQFVLGHFTLGNLTRRQGKINQSNKYYSNALSLLEDYQPNDLLPESDGIDRRKTRGNHSIHHLDGEIRMNKPADDLNELAWHGLARDSSTDCIGAEGARMGREPNPRRKEENPTGAGRNCCHNPKRSTHPARKCCMWWHFCWPMKLTRSRWRMCKKSFFYGNSLLYPPRHLSSLESSMSGEKFCRLSI